MATLDDILAKGGTASELHEALNECLNEPLDSSRVRKVLDKIALNDPDLVHAYRLLELNMLNQIDVLDMPAALEALRSMNYAAKAMAKQRTKFVMARNLFDVQGYLIMAHLHGNRKFIDHGLDTLRRYAFEHWNEPKYNPAHEYLNRLHSDSDFDIIAGK